MIVPDLHPTERVARINGSDLHYWIYREELASSAETVLVVHGLRGTHHGLELIAAGLTGRRVVIPDLPGFGDSGPMIGRHDDAGYAEAIAGLVNELGCSRQQIVLVGHSFGSIVASRLASLRPSLVRRLVLINPIAQSALRGPHAAVAGLTAAYYSLGERLPSRAGRSLLTNRWVVLAASRAMTRTRDKRLRGFIDDNHLRHFSRFHSPAVVNQSFRASVTHTVTDFAEDLPMPVLLVAGEHDEIAPLPGQRALAERLADAELVVIPDVGHLVHYETPDAAAREILRFLQARRPEPGSRIPEQDR